MDKLLALAGGPEAVRTVVDVGANDGADSLSFAVRFPHIRFIAIEPTPDLARRLESMSSAIENYTVVDCAIGVTEGEAILRVRRSSEHNSLEDVNRPGLASARRSVEQYDAVREVLVPVRTLKSVCAELNVDAIDVLHVDAQGSDLDVLVSAGELLQTVRAGVVEAGRRLRLYTNSADRHEIVRFLTGRGFRIVRVVANDRFNLEQNVFFAPGRNGRLRNVVHAHLRMALADGSLWFGRRSPVVRFALRARLALLRRAGEVRSRRS